ncbi:MAG: hypothetical protein ACK4WC_09445 [Rubrimonas sp.]
MRRSSSLLNGPSVALNAAVMAAVATIATPQPEPDATRPKTRPAGAPRMRIMVP